MNDEQATGPAAAMAEPQENVEPSGHGVFSLIGALPPGALVTEAGLARMLGKCTASIKASVIRGELPRPVKIMGKNSWTAGAIVRHIETRLEAEARKFARLKA